MKKNLVLTILSYMIALFMLAGAFAHIAKPELFSAMIPAPIPEWFANGFAAIAELTVAVLLLIPKYRHCGGLAFLLLASAFMPIHIWDLFRPDPAIGPPPAPMIRFFVQIGFIYAGWRIWQTHKA